MPAPESDIVEAIGFEFGYNSAEMDMLKKSLSAAYAKGMEDAAKIAEDYPKRQNPDGEYVPTAAVNMCWREIAAAIRSRIKDQTQ